MHIYEVLPRKDRRGFDLISDVLPFGRLWYDGPVAFLCTTAAAEPAARHGRQPMGIKSVLNVFAGPSSEL
jgi:hypothetical protein